MQLFDAIENCFPAMEKQYQEICPPPDDFWPPVLMERALREEMVDWTQMHLLTPGLSLAFVTSTPALAYGGRPYRRIRLDAMIDPELLRRSKARLRFSRKVSAALVEEAIDSLAQAKSMHDDLEALYNPHVDFPQVYQTARDITQELLARI